MGLFSGIFGGGSSVKQLPTLTPEQQAALKTGVEKATNISANYQNAPTDQETGYMSFLQGYTPYAQNQLKANAADYGSNVGGIYSNLQDQILQQIQGNQQQYNSQLQDLYDPATLRADALRRMQTYNQGAQQINDPTQLLQQVGGNYDNLIAKLGQVYDPTQAQDAYLQNFQENAMPIWQNTTLPTALEAMNKYGGFTGRNSAFDNTIATQAANMQREMNLGSGDVFQQYANQRANALAEAYGGKNDALNTTQSSWADSLRNALQDSQDQYRQDTATADTKLKDLLGASAASNQQTQNQVATSLGAGQVADQVGGQNELSTALNNLLSNQPALQQAMANYSRQLVDQEAGVNDPFFKLIQPLLNTKAYENVVQQDTGGGLAGLLGTVGGAWLGGPAGGALMGQLLG